MCNLGDLLHYIVFIWQVTEGVVYSLNFSKMLILVFLLILQCNSLFFYFNALWDDNHVFLKIFRNGKQRKESDFSRPKKDKVSRKEIKKIRTHVRPINNSDEWKTWFRYFLHTHIYLVLLTYLELLACL